MTRDDPDAGPKGALPAVGAIAERIVLAAAALALVVLGFFFLAAALIAGAMLAGVILIRLWWLQRKIRKAEEAGYLTTEYTVVDRERPKSPRLPPGA
jgi:small-conductance mechanosensitive channel